MRTEEFIIEIFLLSQDKANRKLGGSLVL